MSESIHKSKTQTDEDVMELLSVGQDFDITREEENSLLESDDMVIDSPVKTLNRKPIVFDLNGSTADDDNEDQEIREKFRNERKAISFKLNEPKVREIPDSLESIYQKFKTSQSRRPRKRLNKQRNRFGPQMSYRLNQNQDMSHQLNQNQVMSHRLSQSHDLRQLISERNALNSNQNRLLQEQVLSLTPLMNYQLGLGILNPTLIQNQNQLLMNALLAQNPINPLLNRLQMQSPIGGSLLNNIQTINNFMPKPKPPKEDIQITIINNKSRPINRAKTHTKSQIRCFVDNLSSQESTDYVAIDDMPSLPIQTRDKPQLKTLFSKHLLNKNQPKASVDKSVSTSGGDLFVDALAEAEVGVDNEYLVRMQEMEKKRREIQRMKEQRRLEMADQRLQSAQELKQQIESNQRHFSFN